MKKLTYYLSLFILLLALGACGSDSSSTGPDPGATTGAVEVTVTTGGSDKDEDGYSITVDGQEGQSVENSATITIANLAEGSHNLELTGAAGNCAVAGNNPQTVNITAGETASAVFVVTCSEVPNAEPIIDRIVFASDRDGGGRDIYVMNSDGMQQASLVSSGPDDYNWPTISPDGTRITYEQEATIWVVNANGKNPVQLTKSTNDKRPAWSPDGSKIVFSSFRDGNHEIYIMNADGTEQTNLTNDSGSTDLSPSFSPDGQRIAFSSTDEIITMNINGTDRQNISNNTVVNEQPQYSPDGTKIAFIKTTADSHTDVYTINIDGSNEQQITNDGIRKARVGWSPDGSQLVFDINSGAFKIFVINADGTNLINITNNGAFNGFPNWSPVQKK